MYYVHSVPCPIRKMEKIYTNRYTQKHPISLTCPYQCALDISVLLLELFFFVIVIVVVVIVVVFVKIAQKR